MDLHVGAPGLCVLPGRAQNGRVLTIKHAGPQKLVTTNVPRGNRYSRDFHAGSTTANYLFGHRITWPNLVQRTASAIVVGTLGFAPFALGKHNANIVPFRRHRGYVIVASGPIKQLNNLNFVIDTGAVPSVVDRCITDRPTSRRYTRNVIGVYKTRS